MSWAWTESATIYLARTDLCPRCDHALSAPAYCGFCRADLSTPLAAEVFAASLAVADAMVSRQDLIDALPTRQPVVAPAPAPGSSAAPPRAKAAPTREGSQISVQSVLAVVGAALLAVAAIVFTFLNPDLTNFSTRTTIVAVTTVVFLGGARLLARAKLQFSAEAVGALGMVFVVLDVWAFSHSAPHGVSPFAFAGIGTVFAALVMIAIAVLVRIRSWLWLGLLGLSISPAWFGYAGHGVWAPVLGHLGVGVMALAAYEIIRRLRSRFESRLRADRSMATVVELVVFVVVAAQLVLLLDASRSAGIAACLTALAVLAALSTRNALPRLFSFLAGALFTTASFELLLDATLTDQGWLAALLPLAASAALVVLSAALRAGSPDIRLSRLHLLIGSLVALFGTVAYDLGVTLLQLGTPFDDFVPTTVELASSIGLAATAAGLFASSRLTRGRISTGFRFGSAVTALCFGLSSLIAFTGWGVLPPAAQVSASLACGVLLSVLLLRCAPIRRARRPIRLPILVGAHLLVLHAAAVAWSTPLLSELGGIGVVLAGIALTIAVPSVLRPVHTALGFGYALIVFAHALQLAHLTTIALFCITTALASAVALVITLLRRVPARYWYAVLIVTGVPFVIGIVTVLFVRSGWTALSTGVTFALALTLVLTNRPGLSRSIRALAAALLVPALAVVVVCLGAQVLVVSASPITLPVIAVIVACTLPSTELIGAALRRRGIADQDVRVSQIGIESGALLTGALAVVLALARAAAGLNTSLVVLLIIGIGAAATALSNSRRDVWHRRYAWLVAAASWTGALWCFWGTLGVQVLEPYLLPPAIAAAIIGAVAVLRKLPGLGLYSVGLACAVLPSLVVLAGWGNGGTTPWRVDGLLAASAGLVVVGRIFSQHGAGPRLGTLATPTVVVAIAAGAAGPIEGVRIGLGFDQLWLTNSQPVTLAVLELSLLATALAALGARFLVTQKRIARPLWRCVYVPSVIYLVAAPIAAMRAGWLPVWTMFGLMMVVLAVMIATSVRAQTRAVALPPVWFLFVVAWFTAVAGWSDRYLRVEAFSLPLGISLLVVGALAMRPSAAPRRSPNSWPSGFTGSWWLLAPGIIATFLPSILATGTDPQTLRAILVIALALLAILIGSLRRLGAPFVLGIIVLPVENVTVFAAQIGHTISATSWWITLATAGAVLLVIAVTSERRTGGERGVAARIRDLR